MLNDFEYDCVCDRLYGWEIAELLNLTAEQVLDAALDNDWITEDNIETLLEEAGFFIVDSDDL